MLARLLGAVPSAHFSTEVTGNSIQHPHQVHINSYKTCFLERLGASQAQRTCFQPACATSSRQFLQSTHHLHNVPQPLPLISLYMAPTKTQTNHCSARSICFSPLTTAGMLAPPPNMTKRQQGEICPQSCEHRCMRCLSAKWVPSTHRPRYGLAPSVRGQSRGEV